MIKPVLVEALVTHIGFTQASHVVAVLNIGCPLAWLVVVDALIVRV